MSETRNDPLGFTCMVVTTFGFSGMFLWLFGVRGKGGGTIGSIVTTLILLACYACAFSYSMILVAAMITLIVGLVCINPGERYMCNRWGERKRHTGEIVSHDFNETCIDEVHGMLIAVIPIYCVALSFWMFLLVHICALGLFRFFDAKKIGPVKWAEESEATLTIPGAIMLDDTVAGVLAAMCLIPLLIVFSMVS